MSRLEFPSLSESEMAGQLMIVGVEGTTLEPDLKRRLQSVSPGGIILFARNLVDAGQVAALCRDLAASLPHPPFLAVDQEGGRVNRLKGIFPSIPSNLSLARRPSAQEWVRRHARETGRGLRLLGFNLNFAPVLDLSEAEFPNGIGDRAYGTDPAEVARLAAVFLDGQQGEGVLGCGKHFPGLGGGTVDSHLELPVIPRGAEQIWREDLHPYRALKTRLPMVMVGHAYYPALQGKVPEPATLSATVVGGILREKIGFEGIILTDDLEMGAVNQSEDAGSVVLRALEAGGDLVMYCKNWDRVERAHAALRRALSTGSLSRRRIEDSLRRIFRFKAGLKGARSAEEFDAERFQQVCSALASFESPSA